MYHEDVLLTVELLASGADKPPDGSRVVVQVRDTALQDAPALLLGEARGEVTNPHAGCLAAIEIALDAPEHGVQPNVWAHVDVDGDGAVSRGDYITMQSYPARGGKTRMQVVVKRV